MNEEKYLTLFTRVIGRKPSKEELVRARETNFDPKQMKGIAQHHELTTANLPSDKLSTPYNPIISQTIWRITGLLFTLVIIATIIPSFINLPDVNLFNPYILLIVVPIGFVIPYVTMLFLPKIKTITNTYLIVSIILNCITLLLNIISLFNNSNDISNFTVFFNICYVILFICLFTNRQKYHYYDSSLFYIFICSGIDINIILHFIENIFKLEMNEIAYQIPYIVTLILGICLLTKKEPTPHSTLFSNN